MSENEALIFNLKHAAQHHVPAAHQKLVLKAAAALTAAEERIKMLEAELAHNERRHAHELEVAQSHIGLSARSAEPVAWRTAAEQKAQGARCSCRGVDDYCPCQNVPDAETKKAGSAREDTAG